MPQPKLCAKDTIDTGLGTVEVSRVSPSDAFDSLSTSLWGLGVWDVDIRHGLR